MTEDEAKTKWCPLARVAGQPVAGNRYPFDTDYSEKHAFATCIGSDCMAWRWYARWPDDDKKAWTGYCGAFGEPK